ncbi:MAG: hypothetical protein ABI797_08480 [Chloroflexota bacterium]
MRTTTAAFLCLALILAGCASATVPTATPGASQPPTITQPPTLTQAPAATPGPTPSAPASQQLLPQPDPPAGLDLAPESARVDLHVPTFSNPTEIDNPLFPVSDQSSVLLLGEVDGQAFRTEVTLLPSPRTISWADQQIDAVVSQYVAFLDGRIHEVAYDYYAQDDAGNVWYLGEDVYNFADGAIVDTHGTWIAGIDAPGAMIMPADPQIGDVYRPENAPGLVFEEVTVTEAGLTLDGPFGPVEGAILIEEMHMDGGLEDKTFAPGYGEFYTSGGGDVEALAMAVPTDFVGEPVPAGIRALTDASLAIIEQARVGDWVAAEASLDDLVAARDSLTTTEMPAMVAGVLDGWLNELSDSVASRDGEAAQGAAIQTARSGFDLHLRHREVAEVDLARMDLWSAQLRLDAERADEAGVGADLFAMDYVRDRLVTALDDQQMTRVNATLEELSTAVADGDLAAVAELAATMRDDLGSF